MPLVLVRPVLCWNPVVVAQPLPLSSCQPHRLLLCRRHQHHPLSLTRTNNDDNHSLSSSSSSLFSSSSRRSVFTSNSSTEGRFVFSFSSRHTTASRLTVIRHGINMTASTTPPTSTTTTTPDNNNNNSQQKYEDERRVAVRAVAEASELTRRLQTDLIIDGTQSKADASPVTVADYAVQALVVHRLRAAFPNDRFIAEESSAALRADERLCTMIVDATGLSRDDVLSCISACEAVKDDKHDDGVGKTTNGEEKGEKEEQRVWIMDPIDGTRGFIALRQYCIALGLLVGTEMKLGVLGCPRLPLRSSPSPTIPSSPSSVVTPTTTASSKNLITSETTTNTQADKQGALFYAVRGHGTYMLHDGCTASYLDDVTTHVRCQVSTDADAAKALLCESFEAAHSSHELSGRVAGLLGLQQAPLRMDSQAKYGCMARGDAALFLRFPRKGYVENIWDVAPASIVIEEAGGRVTDGRGRLLNFGLGRVLDNDDGIVATNGALHDQVVAAVQKAFGELAEEE